MVDVRANGNQESVLSLFDAHEVPSDKRIVPSIFTAIGYHSGVEEITSVLEDIARAELIGFMPQRFPTQK